MSVTIDGQSLTFSNLNTGSEATQTNLIMPEPTVFLNATRFPPVSIVRPTNTEGAAMDALQSLIADGLFRDTASGLVEFRSELAHAADAAEIER